MMFVTWASLYSFGPSQLPKIHIPYLDKVVHFTFYFVAAILGLLSFSFLLVKGGARAQKVWWLMGLSLFVYGMGIEVLQHTITSQRTGDVWDMLANGCGVLLGILLIRRAISLKKGAN